MSLKLCLALLALSSLTAADHHDCEDRTKPLEDRSRIVGKWIFYAGTSDNADFLNGLKTINSSWIELTPIADSDDMILRYGDKMQKDGKCVYGSANSTFSENSTKVQFSYNSTTHDHVGKHLVSCPDCIVWTDESVATSEGETKKGRALYLFTKSGTLDAAHFEDFKKQAACLNFSTDFHFGDSTNMCPSEKDANEGEQ